MFVWQRKVISGNWILIDIYFVEKNNPSLYFSKVVRLLTHIWEVGNSSIL